MKNIDSRSVFRPHQLMGAALLILALLGCDDDAKPTTVGDNIDAMTQSIDAGAAGDDTGLQDQAIVSDLALADTMVADLAVDAYVEIEQDIGPLLVQDNECQVADDCGQYQRCAGGLCQIDLRPDVFRVNDITVIEPKLSAGALQGILMVGIANGQLTLLVEPGRYDANGNARWYMGNGNSTEPYVYLHQFPIQTFLGSWRCVDVNTNGECDDGEDPFWHPGDYSRFELIVPTSTTPEGRQCYSRMTTQVQLRVQPMTNDDDTVQVEAELSGYLLARDAASVTFTIGNLQYQLERDFLKEEDFTVNALCNADGMALDCLDVEPNCPELLVPEVRDGCFTGQCVSWSDCCPGGVPGCDGTPDGYPFNFTSSAIPISFADETPNADESNRDANPVFENPIGCE
jgi:hypothetical protein